MIYFLITLVSLIVAWFAYRYEKVVVKNSEILKNYNIELENELQKRTFQLTNQKQQLEDSEFRWKFAVEGSGYGLWDWNVKTDEVYFSKRWKEMLGFKDDEIKDSLDEWKNRIHPDDLEEVLKDISNHMEGKSDIYENEHRILCKNGKYKWIVDRGVIVQKDVDGVPLRFIGTQADIDERKLYQKDIETQRYKYKKLMANSSSAILISSMDAKVIECSNEFIKMLGYSFEEAEKLYIYDFEYIHTKEQIFNNIANLKDKPIVFESKYKTKNGSIIDVFIKAVKISIEDKDYIYTSITDITEKNQLLEITKYQKEEFRTIFQYAQDGIAIIDFEGKFIKVNPAFTVLTGYTESKLLELSVNELLSSEDKEKNQEVIKEVIKKGKIENFEETYVVSNNRKITINLSLSLLPNQDNLLLIAKDTSSLKLIEQQSKLASMGEMIGNIAHQWRQPLSVITTAASGLKIQYELGKEISGKDIVNFSDNITTQAQYLSKTIDNFRNFLKGGENYSLIEIEEVFEITFSIVNATIKNNNISLIKQIEPNLMVKGSINELVEAFINILNNSKDILIEKVEKEEDRIIFISANKTKDGKVQIIFKDTGGGIPDEIIDRVFEPYFTSKHKSIGTGLGLSMADKIIRERHNGLISVENKEYSFNSNNYKGACFSIIFDFEDNNYNL